MAHGKKEPGAGSGWMLGLGLIGLVALVVAAAALFGLRPYVFNWPNHAHLLGGHWAFGRLIGWFSLWGMLQIVLAIWVGVDANRRGLNGLLWGLLVLVTQIVGVIVYLIAAPTLTQRNGDPRPAPVTPVPSPASIRCTGCGEPADEGFKVCPFCGTSLRCGNCSGSIRAGWKVCPQCATPVPGAKPSET